MAARDTRVQVAVRRLVQWMDHAIIEGLDAALLLLNNLGLGFDNIPELDNVILNLLNVDWTRNLVSAWKGVGCPLSLCMRPCKWNVSGFLGKNKWLLVVAQELGRKGWDPWLGRPKVTTWVESWPQEANLFPQFSSAKLVVNLTSSSYQANF